MPGRLDVIEAMLRAALGGELIDRCPDVIYAVNEILLRYQRTQDNLPLLFTKMDSSLFNMVYMGTGRTMVVRMDDGTRRRVTTDDVRDLADRLLAIVYTGMPVTPGLQGELFDLAREGSYAAMRELAGRFPLDADEREWVLSVLRDNGELN